ncbi:hypothetical protein JHK85_001869 [Glycine max]|nr:hypothetical protein JHK85_001869 [Glycine max]KAG5089206.1 hypothetical protein JHK86_001818 [Glycine max]
MEPEETSLEFNSKEKNSVLPSKAHHHRVLSDELNGNVDDIVNIELNVCDTQPSCLGGGNNEFIFSGRLDNQASSYYALRALIDSRESPGDLAKVGSGFVQGAGAPTMFQAMRRILANNYVGEGSFVRTICQSFIVSVDKAHGVHPNFMDKHVGDIPSVYRWEMTNRVVHAATRGGNLKILEELLPIALMFWLLEMLMDLLFYMQLLAEGKLRGQLPIAEALVLAFPLVLTFPSLISIRNISGETFLHKAVSGFNSYAFRRLNKHIELLRNMLRGKNFHVADNINVKNNDGRTALHMAIISNIQLPYQ